MSRLHLATLLVVLSACQSSSSEAPAPDLAMAIDLGVASDFAPSTDGVVLQPIVHPDHGIFELTWTASPGECQSIEIDRRIGGGVATAIERLAGSENDYTDVDHEDSGTFCYQLQCFGESGAPRLSNQQCASQ